MGAWDKAEAASRICPGSRYEPWSSHPSALPILPFILRRRISSLKRKVAVGLFRMIGSAHTRLVLGRRIGTDCP
jgi:hypothetical protein